MVINKKFPGFKVSFKSEENEYSVKYNTNVTPSSELIEDRIVGMQSKNAFADDAGTFSVVLAGDTYWDKLIDVNDIMRIYINPDTTDSNKSYQMVAIGMVSRVAKQGSYDQNQNTYLITGQSFAKPFMKFGLGVIQEVQSVLSSVGWLPDGGDKGIQFTGSNARDVAEQILNRFSKFMKYNYDNKQTPITDFFEWNLDSWTAYENLKDPTPYINFDGSLKQLLDDVTAKPFNESFFRNSTITDKGEYVMRRTPFNVTDWKNLDYVGITTRDVIEEDVSKSDTETNSIFTVTSPQMIKELSPDLFSKPQFHQSLVDRYGYSKLEVENRYIAIDSKTGEGDEDKDKDKESETSKGTDNLTYNRISVIFSNYDKQTAQVNSKKLTGQIAGTYKGVSKKQAKKAVDKFIKSGQFTKADYKEAFNKDPDEEVKEDKREEPTVANVRGYLKDKYPEAKGLKKTADRNEAIDKLVKKYKGVTNITGANLINKYVKSNGQLPDSDYQAFIKSLQDGQNTAIETDTDEGTEGLKVFSKMLFNWYHMNSNFYSGEITIVGNPYIELGKRLFIIDKQDNDNWEFYIESVEHKFTFKEGFKTVIGVTRGLKEATVPEGSPYRFGVLWNKSSDFKGGLLGEKESEDLKKEGYESKKSKGDDSDSSGANDGGSLDKLKEFDGKLPKYDFKTRSGNYFTVNQCTWYCYNRRAQLGIKLEISQSNWWHDAWKWVDRSKRDGYSGGKTPKQGAVAVWQRGVPGGSAQFGHVSIVEKVLDGGKRMKLSEYNFKNPEAYGERTVDVDNDVYFIYDKG
ncbi:tail lysin protein [Staphylococcus phage vB_SsapH-Golestan-100]|nr:tail lysin protein [Staphylococcus phage vB_SsapH-Golestan-100]